MPITPTYPGVYIQELASSTHSIVAAPTNVAVFVGYSHPLQTADDTFGRAIEIFGFQDYVRSFGGFVRNARFAAAGDAYAIQKAMDADPTVDPSSAFADLALAVNSFFLNGGSHAWVVGLRNENAPTVGTSVNIGPLTLTAMELTDDKFPMSVTVRPSISGSPPFSEGETADIVIIYGPGVNTPGAVGTVTETYRGVSLVPSDPNYWQSRLSASHLVAASQSSPLAAFEAGTQLFPPSAFLAGSLFNPADFVAALQQDTPLDKVPIFNLMVIPGVSNMLVLSTALAFCDGKRAFMIMDPLIVDAADYSTREFPRAVQDDALSAQFVPEGANAALYFPYLATPDPVTGKSTNAVTGDPSEMPPSPVVAGIFAGTDAARGVWKAPAGLAAVTNNITGVAERGRMTDNRQGILNQDNINCLREFPGTGAPIVYGARTFQQADQQWKYVPVRRMALFLEQTLYSNLQWVVFEPNAPPLWNAITMSINAFMLGLFKQGAFAGTTPSDSFNVLCNSQTTTPTDVDNGKVNIVVAFAPLKPAEFVIVTISQLAGQVQS